MRQYCQGVHWKKIVFEWRERKHGNQMQWTTGTIFSIRHTMTNSSSKQQQLQQQQYSKTHFVHSSSRQVHTNNILVRSAAASGETAHHVYGTKRNGNSNNTQQREQRRQQHYVRTGIKLICPLLRRLTYFDTGTNKENNFYKKIKNSKEKMKHHPYSSHGTRQGDSKLPVHLTSKVLTWQMIRL